MDNWPNSPRDVAGFTLIELLIVVGLISLIAGIAIPQLAPVIAFSSSEGAARRLAGYGQSAISRAQLYHENLVVTVDLKNQEYWTLLRPVPPLYDSELEGLGEGSGEPAQPLNPLELLSIARTARDPEADDPSDEEMERFDKQADQMARQFDSLARQTLMARAKHVVHDGAGFLDDVGPEFDEFSLDGDQADLEPEEVGDPLLPRTRLPRGIYIDQVRIGEEFISKGTAEIELSPVGLDHDVRFLLIGEDGDTFAVQWDPIIGTGRVINPENFDQ